MLVIERAASQLDGRDKCCPNLLPCRIRHDGPVDASKRHWDPQANDDGNGLKTSYFRGRRLLGREVVVPAGYRGSMLEKRVRQATSQSSPRHEDGQSGSRRYGVAGQDPGEMDGSEQDDNLADEVDEEDDDDLEALNEVANFDTFVVWDHETAPDDQSSTIARGASEWIKFAEAMHTQEAIPHQK